MIIYKIKKLSYKLYWIPRALEFIKNYYDIHLTKIEDN